MHVVDQRYEHVAVDQLAPHPENPNRGNVESIADSIRAHGFYGAVLAQRSTGRIVAGEHRWRAAVKEGATTVPVVFLDITDEQARRIMVADNRHAALATMDDEVLVGLLREFDADGGLDGIGFTADDLLSLEDATGVNGHGEDDEAGTTLGLVDVSLPEPTHDPEPGDVWVLGPHRLVVASVVDGWQAWAPLLDGECLFVPYPGPYALLTERAEDRTMVLVQPDRYAAGSLLDRWAEVTGDDPYRVSA